MRSILALALTLPAVALATPTLSVSGACPGPLTIDITDVTPGAAVTLLYSPGLGADRIPAGSCEDVATGLSPLRRLTTTRDADRDGRVRLTPTAPDAACGVHLQALDGSDCSLSSVETIGAAAPDSCRLVAGILWCFHPTECGRACADTCAANGLAPMADREAWFEAQNTAEECQPIADAFGAFEPVDVASWTYGCMNDGHASDHTGLDDTVNTAVSWLCSSYAGCPDSIIDNMDQLGVACGAGSRKTVCACE